MEILFPMVFVLLLDIPVGAYYWWSRGKFEEKSLPAAEPLVIIKKEVKGITMKTLAIIFLVGVCVVLLAITNPSQDELDEWMWTQFGPESQGIADFVRFLGLHRETLNVTFSLRAREDFIIFTLYTFDVREWARSTSKPATVYIVGVAGRFIPFLP